MAPTGAALGGQAHIRPKRESQVHTLAGDGQRAPAVGCVCTRAPSPPQWLLRRKENTAKAKKGSLFRDSCGAGGEALRPPGPPCCQSLPAPCAVVEEGRREGDTYCKEPLEQVPSGRCLRLPLCGIVRKTVTCWGTVGGGEGQATQQCVWCVEFGDSTLLRLPTPVLLLCACMRVCAHVCA